MLVESVTLPYAGAVANPSKTTESPFGSRPSRGTFTVTEESAKTLAVSVFGAGSSLTFLSAATTLKVTVATAFCLKSSVTAYVAV